MKKQYVLFLSCILFSGASVLFAQGKSEIRKYGIKSITEMTQVNRNGKAFDYKSHYAAFDKNGRTIEEIEYDEDGSIIKKEMTRYDNYDNKIEEVSFKDNKRDDDWKKPSSIKVTYAYNAGNEKTEESEFDERSGKLIKKCVYTYNNKGLKQEKRVYDDKNVLKYTKKYIYTY